MPVDSIVENGERHKLKRKRVMRVEIAYSISDTVPAHEIQKSLVEKFRAECGVKAIVKVYEVDELKRVDE